MPNDGTQTQPRATEPEFPTDESGHARSAAEQLARETDSPIELVSAVYAAEAAELERTARIKTYVGVLATRRARIVLNALHGDAAEAESTASPDRSPH